MSVERERRRALWREMFYGGMSAADIARWRGVSRERASQILKDALGFSVSESLRSQRTRGWLRDEGNTTHSPRVSWGWYSQEQRPVGLYVACCQNRCECNRCKNRKHRLGYRYERPVLPSTLKGAEAVLDAISGFSDG